MRAAGGVGRCREVSDGVGRRPVKSGGDRWNGIGRVGVGGPMNQNYASRSTTSASLRPKAVMPSVYTNVEQDAGALKLAYRSVAGGCSVTRYDIAKV